MVFVKYIKTIDRCPPFRPILSAIGTSSYKIAKFLVSRMNSITSNEFILKDTFCFAKEIVEQDSSLVMGSLDDDSLFTNIPLDETINICINTVYSEQDVIQGINKEEFQNLLTLATKESCFIFNEVLYKQKDGVAMGSPHGPTLANAFLCFYEKKWLEKNGLQNLNEFFVEDTLIMFLLYSIQLIISKSFVTTLILVTRICPFHIRKKKNGKMKFHEKTVSL